MTLGLPSSATGLRQGGSTSVRLITGRVSDAAVVPTSAVHAIGARPVVEVLSGGKLQPAVVTVGAMDPLRTQVLTGEQPGYQVVLADSSSTVTSDSSTSGAGGGLTGRGPGLGAADPEAVV